jgi:hypothetical protein
VSSAAERCAAIHDAALAEGRFADHRRRADHWADLAELFRLDPHREWDQSLHAIAGYLRSPDVLLDIGGGAGRVSLPLAGQVREVVLVEPSESMRGQFIESRDEAGIANARVSPDWWMDSNETGDVVLTSDVTYFVRDIVPFLAKLHNSASRRVIISIWRPTPGDMDNELRRVLFDEQPPPWPGLPELAAVLWEMGLLPDVRIVPEPPWWIPETAGALSNEQAVDLAMRRLEQEDDDPTRRKIVDNLDRLFERGPDGLSPRWLRNARAVLITWATHGRPLD